MKKPAKPVIVTPIFGIRFSSISELVVALIIALVLLLGAFKLLAMVSS